MEQRLISTVCSKEGTYIFSSKRNSDEKFFETMSLNYECCRGRINPTAPELASSPPLSVHALRHSDLIS